MVDIGYFLLCIAEVMQGLKTVSQTQQCTMFAVYMLVMYVNGEKVILRE